MSAQPAPFIHLSRLLIRPFTPADSSLWLRCRSDYRAFSLGTLGFGSTPALNHWETDKKQLEAALFLGMVEVRREFAYLRKWPSSPEEEEAEMDDPGPEEGTQERREWERRRRQAGVVILAQPPAKNRDTTLSLLLLTPYQSLGFGTGLLQWLIPYTFNELGMHRLSLSVKASNERAVRVHEKVGFEREGRKRAIWEHGGWVDLLEMGIVEDEWRERENATGRSRGDHPGEGRGGHTLVGSQYVDLSFKLGEGFVRSRAPRVEDRFLFPVCENTAKLLYCIILQSLPVHGRKQAPVCARAAHRLLYSSRTEEEAGRALIGPPGGGEPFRLTGAYGLPRATTQDCTLHFRLQHLFQRTWRVGCFQIS